MRLKIFILNVVLLIFSQGIHSQVLGQDKTGFSTIIQPSASFNLDVANNVATLDFYQNVKYPFNISTTSGTRTFKTDPECFQEHGNDLVALITCIKNSWQEQERQHANGDNESFLWGFDLKGSSSNGVGILFSDEKIASSGQVSFVLGHQWSRKKYDYDLVSRYAQSFLEYASKDASATEKRLITAIEKEVKNLVDNKILEANLTKSLLFFKEANKTDLIQNLDKNKEILLERVNKDKFKSDLQKINSQKASLKNIITKLNSGKNEASAYKNAKANNQNDKVIQALTALRTLEKNIRRTLDNEFAKENIIDGVDKENPITDIRDDNSWQKTLKKIIENLEDLAVIEEIKKDKVANFDPLDAARLLKAYEDYIIFLKSKPSVNDYKNLVSRSLHYNNHLIYFKSSFLANSFKLDEGDSLSDVAKRFIDKNEQGYRLDAGYTGQFNTYNYLGVNVALSSTNNAGSLSSKTYSYQAIDTTITPNLSTSTEFKALSGSFDRFIQYELNFDYVRLLPLINNSGTLKNDKEEKGNLLLSLNPYIRHRFYDRSETLKPNTSVGFGTYAFNTNSGSIAGGLFIQADDLFNVNRDSAINFTKQITFGVVFKAAIKSFNPANSK